MRVRESFPSNGSSFAAAGFAIRSEPPAAERPEHAAFDCFNEDLVWILDKLVDRTGGRCGILSGYVLGEDSPILLATTGDDPDCPAALYPAIAAKAHAHAKPERRQRSSDEPRILQDALELPHASALQRIRTMQLGFSPAHNVALVASVCKSSRFGFNVLEEMTATRLYPVLSRYVRLWWMHRQERRRASSMSGALDLSDVGILLLDRRGELLFANTRATALLRKRDGLRQNDRAIGAQDGADRLRLQTAIQHALHCNQHFAGHGVGPQAAPVLFLRRSEARRPLIVTVVNVERTAVDLQDPAVIVYAMDPDQSVEDLLAPVCGLYKLTASETRLVHHLVSGLRLAEAATQMHVQLETARAYLKQVFTKTMTHRQADLMRVMLSSAMRINAKLDLAML